jgi:hypothetical protein
MSIITKILNWIRQILGTTNITVVVEPCKVEDQVVEKTELEETTWPFPTSVKPAVITAKPKAPAKPKVVKAPLAPKPAVKAKAMTAKIKAPDATKPVTKPKAPAKPKAPSKKV